MTEMPDSSTPRTAKVRIETANLRIDDLARAAEMPVDTIRYYAREGLLPPAVKSGKNRLYGPEHVERLARIRALQAKRFSLAAIRAILTSDRPNLDGLFLDSDHQYDRATLIAASGIDPELVDQLLEVGLLTEPASLGRAAFDDADLALLRHVGELLAIGMTPTIVVELGRVYVRHFGELQREVHAMLAGWSNPEWDRVELEAMQRTLTANASRLLPAIDQVLNYIHQRTVQRLTLEAVETAQSTGTGVGGVRGRIEL
jgi:DNA-binding transcriptional MerR regulator